jgi:hypothetical protein
MIVVGLDRAGAVAEISWRPIILNPAGWGTSPDHETATRMLEDFDRYCQELQDGSFATRFYEDMTSGLLRTQWADFRAAFRNGGIRGVGAKLARLRGRHVRRLIHRLIPGRFRS